jgi:hypothetical protein
MAADTAHPPAPAPSGGGKPKVEPGYVFGMALAAGIGGGIAIWSILTGFANGADNVGQVQSRWPAVITGIIAVVAALMAFAASMAKKKGGGS